MNLYLAPLEGITGHIYRNALHQCFDGFDKYFIPFISPNQKGHFSTREKKDVMPEHNERMYAVPQILTNNVEDFLCTAQKLGDYGYKEVNLNLWMSHRSWIDFWMRFLRSVIWKSQSKQESEWKIRRSLRQSSLSIINIR